MVRLWAGLALGLLLLSSPGKAAIFGSDDRQSVARDAELRRSLAVARYRNMRTTAFLVGRCHAVTSQHLVGKDVNPLGARTKLLIKAGRRHKVWSTVVRAGHMERRSDPNDYSRDWMLLRLDRCMPEGTPVFALSPAPDLPAAPTPDPGPLRSAGFPIDLSDLAFEPSCRIHAVSYGVWLHDCATFPGSSGSPLFQAGSNGSGPPRVLAIQSAGWPTRAAEPFTIGRANLATPVTQVAAALRLELALETARFAGRQHHRTAIASSALPPSPLSASRAAPFPPLPAPAEPAAPVASAPATPRS